MWELTSETTEDQGQGKQQSADQDDVTLLKETYASKVKVIKPQIRKDDIMGAMKKAMAESAKDTQEKEYRAYNVLIFNAKESGDADRKKRITHDTELIEGLLTVMKVQPIPNIEKVVRLGKKQENNARPLRFRVKTLEEKAEIMANLYKLGDADTQYKEMTVRHDLTHDQREELREVVKKAKEQTEKARAENQPFLFRVRCMPGPYWEPMVKKIRIQGLRHH